MVGRDSENAVIYKTDLILKNNEEVLLENLPFGKYAMRGNCSMEYKLEVYEKSMVMLKQTYLVEILSNLVKIKMQLMVM